MNYFRSFPLLLLIVYLFSAPAQAALVIDQQGLGPSDGVSGGLSIVGQSFQPAASNIAGIDLHLYSVASYIEGTSDLDYTANVTLTLHEASGAEDFGAFSTPALVSETFFLDTGISREGYAEFRWDAIAVTPDTYYAISLSTDNGVFGAASNNPYARGQLMEFGLQRDYFDLDFTTYQDDTFVPSVPVPAAAWLFACGLLGLIGVARSRQVPLH